MCLIYKGHPYVRESRSVLMIFKKYLLSKNSINRSFIKALNILKKNAWLYKYYNKTFYKNTNYFPEYFKNFSFSRVQRRLSKTIFWYHKILNKKTKITQSEIITAKLVFLEMIWSYKA